ncbi:hypothetical protein IEQ34_016941 [Dendrobium chrysotoxum]|uniref:Uncharacterized protein n=1 Tax=Dendrobium chrysotoxum TaxID=161865 RepID=A0AAV7GGM3_DENCH|nr:hypothetical protein IEQ34_016941 [Dendrobium chrysotoxum]
MVKKKQRKRSTLFIGKEQTQFDSQQAPRKRGRPRKLPLVDEKIKEEEDRKESEDEEEEKKKKLKTDEEEEEEEEEREEGKGAVDDWDRSPGSSKRRTRRKSLRPQKSI